MPVDQPTPPCDADASGEEGGDLRHPADSLPPDLMELAAQLGDDAAFLAAQYPAAQYPAAQYPAAQYPAAPYPAARYPATPPAADLPTRDARLSRCTRHLPPVAAVLLLAVGIGLLATNDVTDTPWATERGRRPVAAGAAAVIPVVSLELFTGAEQEAVLDLLEDDGLAQGSFSI